MNTTSLAAQLKTALTGNVLAHIRDPEQAGMIERNTEKLADATILLIGADTDTAAAATQQIAEATAVLESLASAATEDAAGALRSTLTSVVSSVLHAALTTAIGAMA